jgi:DNA-binding transcriptional LysR family regulator
VAVERHLIGDHPHVIIAPAGHWLAREEGLAVFDLTHEVFLTREVGSGTRMLMERLFEASDFTPTIGMEFDSNESIKQGVIAGLGIAFISAHTVATELEDGRLITLDVVGLPVTRQWFVMRRSDKVLLPPAQEAFDFMVNAASRFLPKAPKAKSG